MFSSEQWLANSGGDFYNGVATTSLRFEDGDTPYLAYTPGSAGNRRTWVWTAWIKRSNLSVGDATLFGSVNAGTSQTTINLENAGTILVSSSGSGLAAIGLRSTALLRDVSAWYHLVVAVDTTQATDTNRVKIYINGSQVTSFSAANYPAEDSQGTVNEARALEISRFNQSGVTQEFDGYMTEVHFIDGGSFFSDTSGTANTSFNINSFGETKNGIWIPINTSGLTFGDNGFRLQMKQSGVGTASTSTIGADTSGNTNHFTSSGIVASDCAMPDSPENNFPTMNPLKVPTSNLATLSEGNLKCVGPAPGTPTVLSTMAIPTSGKWYAEFERTVQYNGVGIVKDSIANIAVHAGVDANGYVYYDTGGAKYNNNSSASYGSSWSNGTIIGVAYNADDGELTFYQDNSSQGVAYSSLSGEFHFCWSDMGNNANPAGVWNFGSDSSFAGNSTAQGNTDGNGIGDFYYAPPSGFLALCTANLPEPTIGANSDTIASDHFNTKLYVGNGYPTSNGQTIDGVGFQSDWTWIKDRNRSGYNHYLFDSLRGATKVLRSNVTNAEGTEGTALTSWNGEGFVLGANNEVNYQNDTFVAWNWKAGGEPTATNSAGAGNTPTAGSVKIDGANLGSALAGTIPATKLSANTTAGFSIVTYTGTGVGGKTVGHGLSSLDMFILKQRGASVALYSWNVYHRSLTGNAPSIALNNTNAFANDTNTFNNTAPTDEVFSLSNDAYKNVTNHNGTGYVAYCFAEVEGYSKFGKFIGNGNADGTFVALNFRPAWIMFRSTILCNWVIVDSTRSTYNVMDDSLYPNTAGSEITTITDVDFLSNGFKWRANLPNETNASGQTYIYMAFAESPFKYANAR